MAKLTITLEVDVDFDEAARRRGLPVPAAFAQTLRALRQADAWTHGDGTLVNVESARVVLDLNKQ